MHINLCEEPAYSVVAEFKKKCSCVYMASVCLYACDRVFVSKKVRSHCHTTSVNANNYIEKDRDRWE